MFIRYLSCLLNVYPYVSAILVVAFTFLRNLLSHCNSSELHEDHRSEAVSTKAVEKKKPEKIQACNSSVCPFCVLPYVTHVLTELVLSNNVSP